VLSIILVTAAGASPARAESVAEGLSQPAARALKMGSWASKTTTTIRTATGSWHPTVSVTLSLPRAAETAAKPSGAANPYGLHGPVPENDGPRMTGVASYYGSGEKTATGERFDPSGMTAAHRTLPFGTKVKVTRVDTGDSVVVRINDRGPFKPGRVIDLSEGAAKSLGMMSVGLTDVRLEVMN